LLLTPPVQLQLLQSL